MIIEKKLTCFCLFICIFLLCSLSSSGSTHANCRYDTPAVTPLASFYWGMATLIGEDVQAGDEIRAYVDDVEVNGGCVGQFWINSQGFYGAMNIYGDDVTTPEKDGVKEGDTIHFFICRNGIEYECEQISVKGPPDISELVNINLTTQSCTFYYRDHDQDTYGVDNDFRCLIEQMGEYTATRDGDCKDNELSINPGAQEACDGLDNDCDRKIDVEIADPNNLSLAIESLKRGQNKVLIKTFCTPYSSFDFLLNFKELLDIASLNLDRRDNAMGSFMSTYFFFGKICGKEFELSEDPSSPKILYIY